MSEGMNSKIRIVEIKFLRTKIRWCLTWLSIIGDQLWLVYTGRVDDCYYLGLWPKCF